MELKFLSVCIAAPFIGSLAAFVLIAWAKWGVLDKLQLNASRILGPFKALAHCEFCLLFWFCVLFSLPLIFSINILYLLAPFASAPLAKVIYENSKSTRR